MQKIIYLMGVSGSGKSHIGQLLADELQVPFFDADDYHPISNVEKMKSGIPLTDDDRLPWLTTVNELAKENQRRGCVIACSALKQSYRELLSRDIESQVVWVYLKGEYEQILNRMENRKGHFMKANMLQSQFDALEEPSSAIIIDISQQPDEIVRQLKSLLV